MKMLCFKEDVKGAVHVILSLSVTLFSDNRTKLKTKLMTLSTPELVHSSECDNWTLQIIRFLVSAILLRSRYIVVNNTRQRKVAHEPGVLLFPVSGRDARP